MESVFTKRYIDRMKSLAMNNFIFKSANRLIKNESANLANLIEILLREQRHQRSDLQDIKLMINKLLIDKHLQMQVDEYFQENPEDTPQNEDQEPD